VKLVRTINLATDVLRVLMLFIGRSVAYMPQLCGCSLDLWLVDRLHCCSERQARIMRHRGDLWIDLYGSSHN